MFLYQACEAFKLWHDKESSINEEIFKGKYVWDFKYLPYIRVHAFTHEENITHEEFFKYIAADAYVGIDQDETGFNIKNKGSYKKVPVTSCKYNNSEFFNVEKQILID